MRFLYDSHFESDFLRNLKTFRIFPRCKPILWENPFCFLLKIYSCLLTQNCIRNYIIASSFSYVTPWFSQWFSWIVSLILLACLLASVLCIYGELICRSDKKKHNLIRYLFDTDFSCRRSKEKGYGGRKCNYLVNSCTKQLWLSWNVPQSSNSTNYQVQIRKDQRTHPRIRGVLRCLVTKGAICWARRKWHNATNGVTEFAWETLRDSFTLLISHRKTRSQDRSFRLKQIFSSYFPFVQCKKIFITWRRREGEVPVPMTVHFRFFFLYIKERPRTKNMVKWHCTDLLYSLRYEFLNHLM